VVQYRKLDQIGEGGQGLVFRGERVDDGQAVALKYLRDGADDEDVRRFQREVRMHAQLHHPNILPIVGYRLEPPTLFFIMPLAVGNLRGALAALKDNTAQALSYYEQILAGVEHAHNNGVVHRDLKPENILMLSGPEGDYPALTDFGAGKPLSRDTTPLTASLAFIGTRGYAAPEQYGDARGVDVRCDIYALGVILYELLNGNVPSTSADVSSLPFGLGYVVEKCMQPSVSDRYSSVAELRGDFALFTAQTELLEAPEQAARRLIEALVGQRILDRESLWQLHQIFRDNSDDEILMLRLFPRLPDALLHAYINYFPAEFRGVLRAYDASVSGGLPFEYCDVVAGFYRTLYAHFVDGPTRRLLLGRLLDMGVSHNRFFVMNVVAGILAAIHDPAEAVAARDAIREHPDACRRMNDQLMAEVRLPILRGAIEAAVASAGPDPSG
jgi:serine/threonine protein kinase